MLRNVDAHTAQMIGRSAVVLAVLLGLAMLIAIVGALLSPVWSVVLAVAVTLLHTGRSTGRHAYDAGHARSEGIRTASTRLVWVPAHKAWMRAA